MIFLETVIQFLLFIEFFILLFLVIYFRGWIVPYLEKNYLYNDLIEKKEDSRIKEMLYTYTESREKISVFDTFSLWLISFNNKFAVLLLFLITVWGLGFYFSVKPLS